jgi:hypothetical protein
MECIRLNDNEEFETESYSFNNDYMLGEDVGEWTVEEFYSEPEPDLIIQEGLISRTILTPERWEKIIAGLLKFSQNHPKAWLSKVVTGLGYMNMSEKGELTPRAGGGWDFTEGPPFDVYILPQIKKEVAEKVAVSGFFNNAHIKGSIFGAFILAVAITNEIMHQKMFKKALGRFPADMAKFCMYITELPEVLSPSDVKHFKEEVKILKKDTKWLVGKSYGTKIITPKEKKLCDLMDEQIDDILKMISNRTDQQRQRRMKDRVEQFIETTEEFFKLIHIDMTENAKVETVREYMI